MNSGSGDKAGVLGRGSKEEESRQGRWALHKLLPVCVTCSSTLQNHDEGALENDRDCDKTTLPPPIPSHSNHLKALSNILEGQKINVNGFLGNLRFAKVGLPSSVIVSPSAKEGEGSATVESKEEAGGSSSQKVATNLFSIPLSNMEGLKSSISTISLLELIELLPQLGRTSKDHPDKKKLFYVQDFFRYTESEVGLIEALQAIRDSLSFQSHSFCSRLCRHFSDICFSWTSIMSMLLENMGEAVLASGKKGMVDIEEKMNTMNQLKDESSSEMVNWDKLLPQTVLRVLLVEADDSTRQIIAALLRKCSYRVAAVSDGLKAWEILKKKAPDIDLILTDVELPSISGFALLTLIKEHEICRNIPVTMMSSHDSISMAMKCILKGAADFLIKPVRRNELSTLWRHVWRRHPKKLEATSENNAASNHTTGSVASTQKNNECCEKRSESQSACTSPILEAESAYMQNMQDTSQPRSPSNLSNIDTVMYEESAKLERDSAKHNNETTKRSISYSSEAARCNSNINLTNLRLVQDNFAETENEDESLRAELNRDNPHGDTEIHGCNNELVEPSRGAIDLIATFENIPKNADKNYSLADGGKDKFDFDPQLELSLRSFSGSSCKQEPEERQTLNHSNASAFSWYSSNKLPQPLFPELPMSSAKAYSTELNSQNCTEISGIDTSYRYGGENHTQENTIPLVLHQSGQVGAQVPNSHPGSSPATGVTSDHTFSRYENVEPSIFYTQSGAHLTWSSKSVSQKENSPFPATTSFLSNAESHNSEQHHHWSDASCASLDKKTGCDESYLDLTMHDYPGAHQNNGVSLCRDTPNHINDGSYGSIGSIREGDHTSSVVIEKTLESFSDNGYHDYDEYRGAESLRPSQREAALTKFRLKRKDRCFEKKVRYQNRKRLAEQRPRIKGQFVRQVQNDYPIVDSGGGGS
ncbi:hypothetical protein K1719_026875 [Acacia pycnantha]|nr:hypothetical protein K1719_026875 [Acacia pycnantha]